MPTIEERALALVNAVQELRGHPPLARFRLDTTMAETLMQSIEAHDATLAEFDAFKREVSDALEGQFIVGIPDKVARFIIPKPVDPMFEVIAEANDAGGETVARWSGDFLAALAARGGRIVWDVGDAD